jgi:predicted dehydrogenase
VTAFSLGIIGAGEITRKLHLPVLLNMPGVEIAWLWDRRESQAAMVGRAYGVKWLSPAQSSSLPECDVALLAIPIEARSEYLEIFAQRNTAVLCEKPFAASRAQHQELIDAFPAHRLGAGYQRRFHQSTVLLRRVLQEGWFGPLRRINLAEGDRSRGSGVDHSFLDDGQGGATRGALFDLGTHGIDLIMHATSATGFEVLSSNVVFDGGIDRRVSARARLQGTNTAGGDAIDLDFCVSWLDRQSNILQLHFDRATVWCGLSPAAEVFIGDPSRPAQCVRLSGGAGATTPNQAFYLEWQEFLRGVREQQPSTLNAGTSLLTTGLMEELLAHGRASRG